MKFHAFLQKKITLDIMMTEECLLRLNSKDVMKHSGHQRTFEILANYCLY